MLRGGPQISAQDKHTKQQQQQKQKKRLSFKDPEVEGPQHYSGCRPKHQPGRLLEARRGSLSVENLSLEGQALQVVQSVGSAFSDLSLQDSIHSNYLDTADSSVDIQDSQTETYSNDCFLSDSVSYQRSLQLQSFRISLDDQEYLNELSPPLQTLNMRCPPLEIQTNEQTAFRNNIPSMELAEEKFPSSAQHQIQLLKYQLDQQCQQTQLALHQVQFLSDQMETECAARRKSQEQNNQLMNQNKELLNHIEKLFQQIEDLEKQIQVLEHEKRSKIPHQEPQMAQPRTPLSYSGNRRMSGGETLSDKPTPMNRGMQPTPRRSSLTTAKQNAAPQHKLTGPNAAPNRKSPATSPRQQLTAMQNRAAADANSKAKETLHIGDSSPPVQSSTFSPFGSGWKLKAPEVHQVEAEIAPAATGRTRTGSFSSFSKLKPPENIASKNTLFSSNSGISGITSKKYSSSTSDLYNSTGAFQSTKPLVMEDSSASNKSSISNLNISAPSKLPRFQPYTGRRSSLSKDADQFSAIGKDKFKTTPQTSLYNR